MRNMLIRNIALLIAGLCLLCYTVTAQNKTGWSAASFKIMSGRYEKITTAPFAYMLPGKKSCIVKVAPEVNGLTGITQPIRPGVAPLKVEFNEPVLLLTGIFQSDEETYAKAPAGSRLVLKNAITMAGLPPIHIYASPYSRGAHTIVMPGLHIIPGIIKARKKDNARDAALPDGRLWEPFIVEGFYEKPLFEITGGHAVPVIDEGMPGAEGIQGGFEGGACVKVGETYHLFPTERAGQRGVEAYYDRVKTRIGHWTSRDAVHWTRQSTLYQASGAYAVTDDDNPLNDRRGALWSYMPVFSEEANRWYGYYLAYTVHKEIEPNHSFGRIWRCESVREGREGIGGPYKDAGIIMEPGLNTQLWEGRQGVDSFYPYPAGGEWLAFYGGAYPFKKKEDYPRGGHRGAWYVGLARSATLQGPWVRLDTTVNPVTSMHPYFIENPMVYTLPNGLYIAFFDGGPEAWGLHLPNMIGYALSADGYRWSEARYLPIETKVKKWWNIMRTPVSFIPEGNDEYTILYAAIQEEKRFHPMGLVKVKLNREAMEAKAKELKGN